MTMGQAAFMTANTVEENIKLYIEIKHQQSKMEKDDDCIWYVECDNR